VNNLFDRFDDPYLSSDDPWRRKFASKPKKIADRYVLGRRIQDSQVNVLALQEVESMGALREFVAGHIGDQMYKLSQVISVESNDPRGIDLAYISSYPLGRVTSHRFRKNEESKVVFSRDCLQLEIMDHEKNNSLLTMFNCHLKSKYSEYKEGTTAYKNDQEKSRAKREMQVQHTIDIVEKNLDVEDDPFIILGDMNDTPDSLALEGFMKEDNPLGLVDALAALNPSGTDWEHNDKKRWHTHKWDRNGDNLYSKFDYILLSQKCQKAFTGTIKVEQRGHTLGSDHFLCWAELDVTKLV
jgi:endonuclease/exonuclease/phosphatase family metal-dependent hydrolase